MALARPGALDCVIPAHEKDFETLGRTVASIRRCCPEVGRIVVVSSRPWTGQGEEAAEFVEEAAELWPFRLEDLGDCGCAAGWLLQQLVKLHAPLVLPDLSPDVLVCDADVVFLERHGAQGMRFLRPLQEGEERPAALVCTFHSDACPPIRSAVDLHRYDDFVPAVLPGLEKPAPGKETAVCHHMPLQRDVLAALFARVEEAVPGRPFWAAFRDAAAACGGRASEYELYHAFARRFFPERVVARPLAFAVVGNLEAALESPPADAAFLVAHSHLRGLSAEELRDREGVINGDTQAEIVRRLTQGRPPELAQLLATSGML